MALADLQLDRCRLSSLTVKFNEAWLAAECTHDCDEYSVRPESEILVSKDEQNCMVRLTVRCEPADGAASPCRFSLVEATVWGIFDLSHDIPEEQRNGLIGYNTVAMLHGLARGLIVSATGGCVGGPFILPAINYVEHLRKELPDPGDETLEEALALPEPGNEAVEQ